MDELSDQKRGGAGEDRQEQDRQKDQPQANREIRHNSRFIKPLGAQTKRGERSTSARRPRLSAEDGPDIVDHLVFDVREFHHITGEPAKGCLQSDQIMR